MSSLSVRPALPEDEAFLFDLYCEIRGPEFAFIPWSEEQKRQFLGMQFRAQLGSYSTQYPQSFYQVVLLDGQSIGKLWVASLEHEYRLVDIAVVSESRRLGFGTALVNQVQDDARQAGLPVRSSVFRLNTDSIRWHQRLGFNITGADPMYFHMEWTA